ncbi:MAG: phosphomethylpyrimidine synthase ThiC, partial [Actinobacteria bacterium]|nr:phosphomethylpyrimidine synthase ThiC [Actinomycetota bacterium]
MNDNSTTNGKSATSRPSTISRPVTQLQHARQSIITPQMQHAAEREGVDPEVVLQEVAAGR